jgi:hypothetical protein
MKISNKYEFYINKKDNKIMITRLYHGLVSSRATKKYNFTPKIRKRQIAKSMKISWEYVQEHFKN